MIPVTVIIPVRDEARSIEVLLDDLCRQTRLPAEIVVVDTGSTDDTHARAAERARLADRVRVLEQPGALPGAARNVGLRAAKTPWVAFVDGAMRVREDWLAHLMAPVDRGDPVDLVFGGLDPDMATRQARAAALAYVPARRPTPTGGVWRGVCLPSSAVRRELAFAVGGFPENLRSGEDLLFMRRLQETARIAYAPDAVVRWSHASTPRAVWRRFRTYAEHSLRARLMDDWFDVTARRYAATLIAGPFFLPAVAAVLVARALVARWRKPELTEGSALQALEVAAYLGIIDAATFAAWIAWRRAGSPRAEVNGPLTLDELADSSQAHEPAR